MYISDNIQPTNVRELFELEAVFLDLESEFFELGFFLIVLVVAEAQLRSRIWEVVDLIFCVDGRREGHQGRGLFGENLEKLAVAEQKVFFHGFELL